MFNIRMDKNKEPFKRSDLKNLFQHDMDEERQERRQAGLRERAKCTVVRTVIGSG